MSLLLVACASPQLPPDELSSRKALATYGSIGGDARLQEPDVVIIADRHPVTGRLGYDGGPLVQVRRENTLAVRTLLRRGFDLMGCEFSRGPLPEDGIARRHREMFRTVQLGSSNPDHYNVFQPIRYEMSFAGRLTVLGVEDPELYEQDTERLEEIRALRRNLVFLTAVERSQARARMLELVEGIEANVDARGIAAAKNLLELKRAGGHGRSILFIGAAHVPAAMHTLEAQEVQVLVFRCHALDRSRGEADS